VTWRPMDTEDSDVNARIKFRRTRDRLVVAEHHLIVDRLSSTPSRRWHYSGRAAGPFRKRSFASQAAKAPPGDSGRSRVASTARYKHAAE